MNELRAKRLYLRDDCKRFGPNLVEVPERDWPETAFRTPARPLRVWRSRQFCAHLWVETKRGETVQRLSIHRTEIDSAGGWKDGITWDELQRLKSEAGFGDRQAVEIYPPDGDVVNVANMRHLWLLNEPLACAWRSET